MDKLLLTPTEAATQIGIGRTRIYDLIARGVIPSVRIGRSRRVPLDALREWVSAHQSSGYGDDVATVAPKHAASAERRIARR
jgi:excisionase family DNA binding protein